MTNQKKTDYICISKESEGPAPDTLDETLPYTSAREAFDTGISICRPLYYDHPEVPEALWTYDGANLTMKIYLPEYDISECLTVDCRFPEFSPEKIALLIGE